MHSMAIGALDSANSQILGIGYDITALKRQEDA